MLQIPKVDVGPYVDIALRRKWWIVSAMILSILMGVAYLTVTPNMYRASTLILVEPQSIPDSYVKSTVTDTVERRLLTITQQIHSRTNLEKLIREFNLCEEPEEQEGMVAKRIKEFLPFLSRGAMDSQEDRDTQQASLLAMVQTLKRHILVINRDLEANLAFEIAFEWYDPDIVAPVTNAIATNFIKENMDIREELAMGTTDFLSKEAAVIKVELETRERELEAFKREHMGMLPDQLDSNINIISQLKDELSNLEREVFMDRQQAMLLSAQSHFSRMQREALLPSVGSGTEMTMEQITTGDLEDVEDTLIKLSSRYTEKHPDIVALKRRIAVLKDEKKRGKGSLSRAADDFSQDPMNLRLKPINASIQLAQNRIEEIKKQIEVYKHRVERTPQVELELNKIMRDYETVRARYHDLLAKKLDAKMAEELEKRQKGEQFRVLDPAIKPVAPFEPDPLKVMFLALVGGLCLGCGLAYLKESLDPHFYDPEEIETLLGTNVIVSLPTADSDATGG